jgi:DNA-binding PadR family transcriptional regulator
MPRRPDAPLTDLEAAALGCIWKKGGCTAYAIRKSFRESPSARFTDSAGTVYPMLERLAGRGLLRSREENQGRRPATVFACTPRGLTALRRWLEVPDEPARLATWDPLRTRALYLGLLTAAERGRWIREAEATLGNHLETTRGAERAERDPWMRAAHRNSVLQTRARLKWLQEMPEAPA